MFLQPVGQPVIGGPLNQRSHLDVAQLGLGLTLELRIGQADAEDGGQPLANVLALEIVVVVLEEVPLLGIAVHHRGQRATKSLLVHPPLEGVDAVGEGVETIGVEAGIPLEGHLDLLPVLNAFDVADFGKQGLLGGIHVGHEVADAPLVLVVDLVTALVRPFVSQSDP